ncbi:MAG: aminopeptidase N [Arenicellales bacterium]
MKTDSTVICLKDYQPHPFKITHSTLEIDLEWENTRVRAIHQVERQMPGTADLELDCERINIETIKIDDQELSPDSWSKTENKVVICNIPDRFQLEIFNSFNPTDNTQLSGLYRSGDMLCTQCEAEGYRRITPAIDRPDNLATYTVTLRGDHQQFPVLLCNGNLVASETVGGRNCTVWDDPFPKPTYLFAVVAGSLSELRDTFTTMNGRVVDLRFYARDQDIEKCEYAMDALKRSMKWDEEVYGREYDLDLFNVVAVSDFNMGAMENKSLNIFNTKYVLADTDTATDTDFLNVERVIGHEYFHNWSGNRVTCRDWFQLSLKEGFTVFRDQEFSADMGSPGVQRINDVNVLRNHQFPEDAGPMAHPIRPESYSEINNFYTVTIYEKGAEVVRMLRTLVGKELFRKGTDLYFNRHDGQAVTTDDFVAAISDASGVDLEQFKNWYKQAGTPEIIATSEYDESKQLYQLHLEQHCAPTPGQTKKKSFVIPISVALIHPEDGFLPTSSGDDSEIIVLNQKQQTFSFRGISKRPVPSLLRKFTSPVKLNANLSTCELGVIFRHENDPFARWEAGQQLFQSCILKNIQRLQQGKECRYDDELVDLVGDALESAQQDLAFVARLLSLPGESWLAQLSKPIDPAAITGARLGLQQKIGASLYDQLTACYQSLQSRNTGAISQEQVAVRSMRDICLEYLTSLDIETTHQLAISQLRESMNMTDRMAALSAIASSSSVERFSILEDFYQKWHNQALVLDKWFRVQATAVQKDVLTTVKELCKHPAFDPTNPNKVYALILGFTHGNPSGFHQSDGSGYRFLTHWVTELDPINPQVSSRLISAFNNWQDMIPLLGKQMRNELKQIASIDNLSPDVSEVVSRALAQPTD